MKQKRTMRKKMRKVKKLKRRKKQLCHHLPETVGEPEPEPEPNDSFNLTSINDLPDDLLVKILSIIPTKNAVATSVLSKRWESLWKLVPKLEFSDSSRKRSSQIINKLLLQNNVPVLETLHLKLSRNYEPEEYENWVKAAVTRHVRDLELVHYGPLQDPLRFPRILYTCQTLVTLRLQQAIIIDVPSTTCFKFLKNLSLIRVDFSNNDTVSRLFSACPNLETLIVRRWNDDNLYTFTIAVPSLQSLCIDYIKVDYRVNHYGFVINAPSLKTLKIDDNTSLTCLLTDMPELVKAEINLRNGDSKLLGCLASTKHLSLCLRQKTDGFIKRDFDQLVSLELCSICSLDWLCLILKHTPKLRVLKFMQRYCGFFRDHKDQWKKPSCTPECLSSSLETVEWVGYKGRRIEREMAIYILENAKCLKTVAIIPPKYTHLKEKLEMLIELKSTSRSLSKFLL